RRPKELEGPVQLAGDRLWKGPVLVRVVKNITGRLPEGGECLPGGVQGDGLPLHLVVPADVVDAEDVVGVGVGVEQGVQARQAEPDGLQAKLGRRVDDEVPSAQVDPDRWPRAVVSRIRGRAYVTSAADDRHSLRGAGPEKDDAQPTFHSLSRPAPGRRLARRPGATKESDAAASNCLMHPRAYVSLSGM